MTVEEYYAAVRRLGLMRTNVATVYRSASGDLHNIPDPARYTPEQRAEIIERLRATLDITQSEHD